MKNTETITKRVEAAVARASDESYEESAAGDRIRGIYAMEKDISDLKNDLANHKSDSESTDTYVMARIEELKAGLRVLTEIVEEQGEVINGFIKVSDLINEYAEEIRKEE